MLDREKKDPYVIQMNQMTPAITLIGGQNYEAAKEGRYEVNTKGSLVDYETALIDEIDKGNPATLAVLLSLLNEGKVFFGNKVYSAALETMFSTSNKNLYEFYAGFEKSGDGSTAGALLNRFSCITFVPNRLPAKDQQALDDMLLEKKNADFFGKAKKEIDKSLVELDWKGLRSLADVLFVTTPEFNSMLREFVNKLTDQLVEFEKQEEERYRMGELPYYPTVQYTERLRQKVIEVILASLTLDFLSSSIAEDIDKLEATLKNEEGFHRFRLTPLSLWRAYPILTTVSYGKTKLSVQGNGKAKISIDFSDFLDNDSYKAANKRIKRTIYYIQQERDKFKSILSEVLEAHQKAVEKAESFSSMIDCEDSGIGKEAADIERMLLHFAK